MAEQPVIGTAPSVDTTIRLDEWIARHGPLWPTTALVVVLEACGTASQLDDRTLRNVIGSLNPAGVIRQCNGWTWVPTSTGCADHAVGDHQIIERLGAILFCALSGDPRVDPFGSEAARRTTLRASRPELSSTIVDLALGALSVRGRRGVTLAAFAREIRQALGVERRAEPRLRRMTLVASAVTAMVLFSGAVRWALTVNGDRVGTNGLTTRETIHQDITYEFATTDALIDEHTAAIRLYVQWGQVWEARLTPEDPRLIWSLAHEAWVRTLAGDRFTTEQLLSDAPDLLARQLGDHHPYTRAARLALAETVAARGATKRAEALHSEAERDVRALFQSGGGGGDLLDGVPAPPGVLAHVSPNPPEREAFRAGHDGGFSAPLTSIQRLIAGRDGWRLHIVANGSCRTSVVVGNVPRRITLEAWRGADNRWQVQVQGTKPVAAIVAGPSETANISLIADSAGQVLARVGHENKSLEIDTEGGPTNPPYALTFASGPVTGLGATRTPANGHEDGCAVVWFEIPFPYAPGAKVTTPPVSP